MTDIKEHIDLDEYSQLLADLETEVREYGNQRKSLQDVVESLKALNTSSATTIKHAEKTLATGEELFTKLDELDIPGEITNLQSRYEQHQQSLSDASGKMQQMVQEQQRASLEALQNSQHLRESLERITKEARATGETHDGNIAGVAKQVDALSSQVSSNAEEVSATLRGHGESLRVLQRQLAWTRTVAVVTLVVLVVFATLVAFNVV